MRWLKHLRRHRRTSGDEIILAGYRPGSWAETALPPLVTIVQQQQQPPPAPPAAPVPSAPAEPASHPKVRLGFADGTSVGLDDDVVTSQALQNVAAVLRDGHSR